MIMDEFSLVEGFGFLGHLRHGHSIESMFSLSIRIDISLFHYRYIGNQDN